jgi:cyanobactin cluster PatC/TenC/TruC protein
LLSEVPIIVPEFNVELGVIKTMSKEKKIPLNQVEPNPIQEQTTSVTLEKKEEIQKHLLATGLEDYGFWWQEMLKVQANKTEPEKPFRRGRIWT